MGWYIRKYVKVGPFRLNLSKSGIGISAGVKGARIGFNSKGVYTHLGRMGLYHRDSISWSKLKAESDYAKTDGGNSPYQHPPQPKGQISNTNAHPLPTLEPRSVPHQVNSSLLNNLEIDISLVKDKSRNHFLLGLSGFCILLLLSQPPNKYIQLVLEITVGAALTFMFYNNWQFKRSLAHANRLYDMLHEAFFSERKEQLPNKLQTIHTLIQTQQLDNEFWIYSVFRFYRDFLKKALSDLYVSQSESEDLNAIEQLVPLNSEYIKGVKLWAFNVAFGQALTDGTLSKEEEQLLLQSQSVLGLSNEDIKEQRELLEKLHDKSHPQQPSTESKTINCDPQSASVISNTDHETVLKDAMSQAQIEGLIQKDSEELLVVPNYKLPPSELLLAANPYLVNEVELMEQARLLVCTLASHDIGGTITQIHPGPVVTIFEFRPDAGIQFSKIKGLADDLSIALKVEKISVNRIPGKATIGIEVPNNQTDEIRLRDIIESAAFKQSSSQITVALGKNKSGSPFVRDLARMPHLLISGGLDSDRSALLDCIITSILYKATPNEAQLILIDLRRVEFGLFLGIPNLISYPLTELTNAENALKWAITEMGIRYKKLSRRAVRNIEQYNEWLLKSQNPIGGRETPLPRILIIISELGDFGNISRDVHELISLLADRAHTVGIHIVASIQSPSDYIPELISAGFLGRISFRVPSKNDSQVILGCSGAEELAREGDALFVSLDTQQPLKFHSALVSDAELHAISEYIRQSGKPVYNNSPWDMQDTEDIPTSVLSDDLYNDAVRIVVMEERASTSLLQRRLSIGYGRAAKLIDMMFHNNIVGPADGSNPREILVGLDYIDRL